MKRALGNGYELDDDVARIDRAAVHAYLGGESYWAEGRTRDRQDVLIDASARVVGLYHGAEQVGFARAVDCDAAGFMYLADVYVLEDHRGRGLGLELVREIVDNGSHAGRRWVLHTRDMHGLYAKLGFGPNPRTMERGATPR
jgi:GNAT superfamily N-acetyltransferase